MEQTSPTARLLHRLTWVAVALGVLVRLVRFALPFPLWSDEIFVCQNFFDRDFATILNQLENGQICPPLFLWLQLATFKLLGGGEQAMRLLPLVAGLLGLLGFARLAPRLLPPLPSFLAVGFLSLAIWPISMCVTAKPYSFDLLAAVAILTVALNWRERPASTWHGAAFAVALPVAMLASYTASFVAGAALLVLLPAAWNGGVRLKALYATGAAGLFAAFAFVLKVGHAQLETPDVPIKDFLYVYWRHGFPPDNPTAFPAWLFDTFTGRMFAYPIGDGNHGSTLTALMFAVGIWAWVRRANLPAWQLVLLLVPILLNFVAALMWRYPFGACGRLTQYAAPSICVLAGLGSATFLGWLFKGERAARILGWAYTVIFGLFAIGYVGVAVRKPYHDAEALWGRESVADFVAKLRPGDRVVMRTPINSDAVVPRWHLRLLGDRITWKREWPADAPTGRVWVLDFWLGKTHAAPPLTVPPGWMLSEYKRYWHEFLPPDDEWLTLTAERYDRE